MINFILEYKWLFFIFGEIIFWGSIIGFLLLRYGLGLDKLSKYLIIIWLLSDLWLLALGVLDYIETGSIDAFQIVIVVVLIYVFTAGKSDLQKLDRMIKRKFEKRKNPSLNNEINSHNNTIDVFKERKKEIKRLRSEERRVGKECRTRGGREQEKKNKKKQEVRGRRRG